MSRFGKTLPYGAQSISDKDIDAVVDCLRSDFLTQGPRVETFEENLCAYTGAQHAVAVSSGTAGLHLACAAFGLGPGAFGLTSAVTFAASANAIRYTGARAGLIDVDPRSGLVTPETLEQALSELRAENDMPNIVVPVDLGGQPVDLVGLTEQTEEMGAILLQDAAHSIGATYRSPHGIHQVGDGSYADATIFSFHPVKHITTGEGGAVVTDDAGLAARVRSLRSHGVERNPSEWIRSPEDPFVGPWYYEQQSLGFNYRLPDLNCALGISQLQRLSSFVERRRELASRYNEAFSSDFFRDHVAPQTQNPAVQSSYHLYILRILPRPGENLEGVATRRKALYGQLLEAGIRTQVHYIPLAWHPNFKDVWRPSQGLRGAEQYYAGCLSLPLFPGMQNNDIDRVVSCVEAFFKTQ